MLEVLWPNPQFGCFVHSDSTTSKCEKDLSVIAAKCSHAIYVARDCVHWDSKKPLLQLSHQEGKKQTNKKVANSDILSLSEHQLQLIQENKMRALAKLASNGKQAVSISVNAVDAVSTSVNSVKWSDMSGGSLTDVRTYTLSLTELQQKRECARSIKTQRKQLSQIGPETLFRDPT